jgi:hypothetical protein
VEGAELIIVSDSPTDRMLRYTDENGEIELSFNYPGEYIITARKGDDASVISRPFTKITVVGEAAAAAEFEAEAEESEADVYEAEAYEADEDEADEADAYEADEYQPEADAIDYAAIEPMPMPVAPITFNPETRELYVMGQKLNIPDDLLPFFNDTYGDIYIPFRAFCENIGAGLEWHADTHMVTVTFAGETFNFFASDRVNGMPIININDRLFVPSAFIINSFDLSLI